MLRPMIRRFAAAVAALALIAPASAGITDYTAYNAALKPPAAAEVRIVFIGDSITSGWIAPQPTRVDGATRIGRGIAGQTSAGVRARFAADVLALQPRIVHILVGTNDIAGNGGEMTLDDTRANIAAIAGAATAAGARVIVGTLLPTTDYYWRPGRNPAPKIAEINAWIRREAAANHYVVADYFTPMAAPDGSLRAEYSRDGTHPNAAGHKQMEAIAAASIAEALR